MTQDFNFPNQDNPYASKPAASIDLIPDGNPQSGKGDIILTLLIVLAVLQIVFGLLEIVMGGGFIAYAFFFPEVMAEAQRQNPAAMKNTPPGFMDAMFWYLVIIGALTTVASILRIVSGVRLFYFRGRMLTILSLVVSLISIGTFYCACTSIPIAIFGLIIMFHPTAAYVFGLTSRGMTAGQVRDHFAAARLKSRG